MDQKKILIAVAGLTLLIIVGAVLILGNNSSKAKIEKTAGAKIETQETSFDFKSVAFTGGVVEHRFPIKNAGEKDLQIANLATSCMCTQVFFQGPSGTSPKMGMKGMMAPSNWTGILKSGESGEVVAIFDPAYHGPTGVGPISRIVSFETNDGDRPYVELTFQGVVVK